MFGYNNMGTWPSYQIWYTTLFKQFYKVINSVYFKTSSSLDLQPTLNIKFMLDIKSIFNITL